MVAAGPGSFPWGVADPSTGVAVLHDRAGRLLALDLRTGEPRWRAGASLRPVALVGEVVVAARIGTGGGATVELLDARDGRELRSAGPLPLPEWVEPALEDTPSFALRAAVDDAGAVLTWTARARYGGGAPPGPGVAAAAGRDAGGAVRLDVTSATVVPLPEVSAAGDLAAASVAGDTTQDAPVPSADPEVLEQRDVGDGRYQLLARPGPGGDVVTLIRRVERDTGRVVWETPVDQAPPRRRPALRP